MDTRLTLEEVLHPRIQRECLRLFLDGEFKHAAREAMVQVELAMKEKGRYEGNQRLYGVKLCNELLDLDKKGLKLRVPFGPETQKEVHAFAKAAFAYYRNYAVHDGRRVGEQDCLRIMIIATELLDLVGASEKSFDSIGGVDGLLKYAGFSGKDELSKFLTFLCRSVVIEDAMDGFFEEMAEGGFSEDQLRAVIEVGLADYISEEATTADLIGISCDERCGPIGRFNLTRLGEQVLADLTK